MRYVVLALHLSLAIVSLLILILRVGGLFQEDAQRTAITGGELNQVYNVYKAAEGFSVYEDPRQPPLYATSLYNTGFYHLYGLIGRPFGENVAERWAQQVALPQRAVLLFSRGQGAANLALAAVSVTVALALGAYLRSVRARWLEQKARRADRRPRS